MTLMSESTLVGSQELVGTNPCWVPEDHQVIVCETKRQAYPQPFDEHLELVLQLEIFF